MLIAHSTFSCALAYKGNRVRETLRLQKQSVGVYNRLCKFNRMKKGAYTPFFNKINNTRIWTHEKHC